MSEIIKPTCHTNGTSANELYRLYEDAGFQVGDAIKTLQNAAPNGRDYYPQGPEVINEAMRQHEARVEKLRAVLDDLQELAGHCAQFVKME